MILIGASELNFEKSKYLILRDLIRRREGSHVVLYRHDKHLRRGNRLGKRGEARALTQRPTTVQTLPRKDSVNQPRCVDFAAPRLERIAVPSAGVFTAF